MRIEITKHAPTVIIRGTIADGQTWGTGPFQGNPRIRMDAFEVVWTYQPNGTWTTDRVRVAGWLPSEATYSRTPERGEAVISLNQRDAPWWVHEIVDKTRPNGSPMIEPPKSPTMLRRPRKSQNT